MRELQLGAAATINGGPASAIEKRAPHVQIIFDRFHVQRLAHDALDEIRREVARLLRRDDDLATAKAVKGSRFSLHRREDRQTDTDRQRLSEIQRAHKPLFRAYMLKETLAQTLDIPVSGVPPVAGAGSEEPTDVR